MHHDWKRPGADSRATDDPTGAHALATAKHRDGSGDPPVRLGRARDEPQTPQHERRTGCSGSRRAAGGVDVAVVGDAVVAGGAVVVVPAVVVPAVVAGGGGGESPVVP